MCISTGPDPQPKHPALEVCEATREEQHWKLKVNDMNQPPPAWARFAEDLNKPKQINQYEDAVSFDNMLVFDLSSEFRVPLYLGE